MTDQPIEGRVFGLFAQLLDYPGSDLGVVAAECAAGVAMHSSEAAELLREFASFAERTPRSRLEEIYTGVFELDATHHPYVGHHLFGESYKRSAFLLGLKDRYRPHQIECGSELPDHLAMMLRFLAVNEDSAEAEEMIGEALYPALGKMLKSKTEEPPDPDIPEPVHPGDEYRGLLRALCSVLQTMVAEDESREANAPVEEARLPMLPSLE